MVKAKQKSIDRDHNTEQRILEVAERLFLEKGYAMTSTVEIAKEVGCNQALIHYYFRTKQNLFDSIFEKKAKLAMAALLDISKGDLPFLDKIRHLIETHFDLLQANPMIPFLFFNELTTNPDRVATLKARIKELPKSVFEQIDRELKHEIAEGRVRDIKTLDLIVTLFSLNVALFLGRPLLLTVTGMTPTEFDKFILSRKKENVTIIMQYLSK